MAEIFGVHIGRKKDQSKRRTQSYLTGSANFDSYSSYSPSFTSWDTDLSTSPRKRQETKRRLSPAKAIKYGIGLLMLGGSLAGIGIGGHAAYKALESRTTTSSHQDEDTEEETTHSDSQATPAPEIAQKPEPAPMFSLDGDGLPLSIFIPYYDEHSRNFSDSDKEMFRKMQEETQRTGIPQLYYFDSVPSEEPLPYSVPQSPDKPVYSLENLPADTLTPEQLLEKHNIIVIPSPGNEIDLRFRDVDSEFLQTVDDFASLVEVKGKKLEVRIYTLNANCVCQEFMSDSRYDSIRDQMPHGLTPEEYYQQVILPKLEVYQNALEEAATDTSMTAEEKAEYMQLLTVEIYELTHMPEDVLAYEAATYQNGTRGITLTPGSAELNDPNSDTVTISIVVAAGGPPQAVVEYEREAKGGNIYISANPDGTFNAFAQKTFNPLSAVLPDFGPVINAHFPDTAGIVDRALTEAEKNDPNFDGYVYEPLLYDDAAASFILGHEKQHAIDVMNDMLGQSEAGSKTEKHADEGGKNTIQEASENYRQTGDDSGYGNVWIRKTPTGEEGIQVSRPLIDKNAPHESPAL
jgi:hypothetical protein